MVNQNPKNPAIYDQFIKEWGTNLNYKTALIERRKQEANLYFSNSSLLAAGAGVSALVLIFAGWLFYDNVIKRPKL